MSQLNHPKLGALKGLLRPNNVLQFHNLPFAVAERFGDPILRSGKLSDNVYDASKLGPTVQQPSFTMKGEYSLIGKELPSPQFEVSEKSGLNLVVSIPEGTKPISKLPVFVWIHGGGFLGGSGNWTAYDHSALVALSSEMNTPIIGVGVNYRLGPLGFLTSSELAKVGITGNYGIKDQRVALEWVQENIAGFGGDPSQVTLIGQSAGGVSTTLHFYSPKPLFRRAAAIGGTSILMGPQPIQFHDAIFPRLLDTLGIDQSLPIQEKVRLLKETPENVYPTIPPSIPSRPVYDGTFIPEIPNFKGLGDPSHVLGKPSWLEAIVLTDCQSDGHILRFGFGNHKNIAITFAEFLHNSLPQSEADKVLSTYGIDPSLSDAEALDRVLDIFSAAVFYAPAVTYAKAFEGRSYLLHFDQKNTFPGPLNGKASHILDAAYLFQNFNEFLNEKDVDVARDFGRRMIKFICGKMPWSKFDEKRTALVLRVGEIKEIDFVNYEGRQKVIWEIIDQVGGDKFVSVLFGYMASAH